MLALRSTFVALLVTGASFGAAGCGSSDVEDAARKANDVVDTTAAEATKAKTAEREAAASAALEKSKQDAVGVVDDAKDAASDSIRETVTSAQAEAARKAASAQQAAQDATERAIDDAKQDAADAQADAKAAVEDIQQDIERAAGDLQDSTGK